MRKVLINSVLFVLVGLLAAFGCTTNRTHADGEPYIGGPSVGPSSPTSNSSGTSVPATPPPMTSSYRGSEQAELTAPRPHRLTPDEAALVMADHLPKVRVLGPADPGTANRPYVSAGVVTGQVAIGSLQPVTVNTTLNSPATPAVTNGSDVFGGTAAAPVFPQNFESVTPTAAASTVTPTVGGTTTVTPTAAASTVTPTTTTGTTTTASSAVSPTTTASPVMARGLNANVTTQGNVQVLSTNGRVTVTNVSASSKQQ